MNPEEYISQYLEKTLETLERLPKESIAEIIRILDDTRIHGRQIFLCGNGGSAGTSSHFANDLGKGASVKSDHERFRVFSLVDNVPWMTALANDLDYSDIFLEQLKNFARPKDVLIGISGSGNSPNVIKAIQWANDNDLITIGLTGIPGGQLLKLSRYPLQVESSHMGHIEDGHFLIQHLIGYYFMER